MDPREKPDTSKKESPEQIAKDLLLYWSKTKELCENTVERLEKDLEEERESKLSMERELDDLSPEGSFYQLLMQRGKSPVEAAEEVSFYRDLYERLIRNNSERSDWISRELERNKAEVRSAKAAIDSLGVALIELTDGKK